MGTTIESICVTERSRPRRWGALGLADAAVRGCLAEASIGREQVDLLISAGVYRDRNLGEPALAALIQDDTGLTAAADRPDHGTFSFDVANGTCGPLTSLQVVDGFLRTGAVRCAVVVASDADPGHRSAPGFPFGATGAAAVCTWHDDGGLGPFRWTNAPATGSSLTSVVRFEGGRNRLRVDVADDHAPRAAGAAAQVAGEVLADAGVAASDVDAVVVAPGGAAFVGALADALGVPASAIVHADPCQHTSSLLAALDRARADGRVAEGTTALLVSAGSGITAGACLYRPGSA